MQLLCVYVRAFEHAAFAHNVFCFLFLVSAAGAHNTAHTKQLKHALYVMCTLSISITNYLVWKRFVSGSGASSATISLPTHTFGGSHSACAIGWWWWSDARPAHFTL